jgi:hypothetical protein
MKRLYLFIPVIFAIATFSFAGEIPKRIYNASKLTTRPPVIDGKFDDPAWLTGEWDDDFIQLQPYQGREPSQKTVFKILYDDNNIYVAIKAFDSAPDSIERRLTPKDDMDMSGDIVGILFDSYHDRRTSFNFMVSAGGVKSDYIMSNDGQNQDATWDPIWYVKTRITEEGWNAEMRIPLSQLRFSKVVEQVWGLEVARYIYRKQELSLWQLIPNDAPGMVHMFGEMHGISGIKPKKQLEIAPYGVGSYEHYEPEDGNPFRTGKGFKFNAGVDGKVGLTNNITMDFTVNPDFGQVEADPSQLNLTAYETFYEEKRPFFVEGKNIFNYQLMIGDGDMASENLFYSRRIGRRPQGYPSSMQQGDHADIPDATTILGAAKISGKTKNGLSIGILESVTAAEKAEIDHEGERSYETVEPLSNYAVARLQKDYGEGKTSIGGIITSVNRKIDGTSLNYLRSAAYTGGLDFSHSWNNRNYNVSFKTVFSSVFGDTTAMIRTQRSSSHYYQRPDAPHLRLDSSRTSLYGSGGTFNIGKVGGGHWQYMGIFLWKTPGLELNDIGYIRQTDMFGPAVWVGYRMWEPVSVFRKINFNINGWSGWNFGGNFLGNGYGGSFFTQFMNYWTLSAGVFSEVMQTDNNLLRGGPAMRIPGMIGTHVRLGTDERKKLNFSGGTFQQWGFEQYKRTESYSLSLFYRPVSTFQITLTPRYTHGRDDLQYVTEKNMNDDARYLFAHIRQQVVEMSIRLSFSILPNLNIQFWGQPFIASGKYDKFKYITDPKADLFTDRYHLYTGNEISYDEDNHVYLVDENGDASPDYYFLNPDFNYKSFKSNLVLRWEFVPGSNLYLVWSQNRNDYDPDGGMELGSDLKDLAGAYPYNIFLIKFSYRFIL